MGQQRDFNPRPLAGATAQFEIGGTNHKISIHAPLRGRLDRLPAEKQSAGISIHAPLRGRLQATGQVSSRQIFQSTPPCGGDGTGKKAEQHRSNFNPRPLAGATTNSLLSTSFLTKFQSTPPCGGDFSPSVHSLHYGNFNPRPLAGATRARREQIEIRLISIHAPLRGRRSPSARQSR